ncbi:MAG: hypothetical protein MJA83_18430, partial [Gammaproteobacteria bacterium]|nr:hypothetical protein [Gammaproteobacteria bacterium]
MASNRNVLSSIDARTGLETPQVILDWEFASNAPQISSVRILRSTFRFPESSDDGTVLLNEAQTIGDLRVDFADITPSEQEVQYYSVFFDVFEPFSQSLNFSSDIERLGLIRGVAIKSDLVLAESIGTGNGILTTFTGNLANTPIAPGSVVITTIAGASPITVTDDSQGNLI